MVVIVYWIKRVKGSRKKALLIGGLSFIVHISGESSVTSLGVHRLLFWDS